jgi:hypothetical protein
MVAEFARRLKSEKAHGECHGKLEDCFLRTHD